MGPGFLDPHVALARTRIAAMLDFMMTYLLLALTLILWTIVHSLTAATRWKNWVRERLGDRAYAGLYRLSYNLFSLLTFLPVLYLLSVGFPERILWRASGGVAVLLLLVQGIGLVGLAASLLQTGPLRFLGVRQAIRYLQGVPDPDPPDTFVDSGTYRLVRHPLYFFSLLVLWPTPVMTISVLIFNLLATAYFYIGSRHEERRLEREFGDAYRRYRERVPGFLPFLR